MWIPAVTEIVTIARNGARIRIIRIKDRARHLAVSIVFPWRRGFRFDIDHQREPRNTRNTRNVEKKISRCCARIQLSGSGRSSQVNRVFGPRSEPHDLVAPLVDDRQIDCSLFVCFVCFVVPNLPRSGLQPCSVRSKNLATLSSAPARWVFDLTLIAKTIYAFRPPGRGWVRSSYYAFFPGPRDREPRLRRE